MGNLAPGVVIRYVTDGPITVRAGSTSTPVFIGPTVIGKSVSGNVVTPTLVTSAAEFADVFSTRGCRFGPVSLPASGNPDLQDPMGHAIRGFFLNGGSKAYVVSTSQTEETTATASFTLKNGVKKLSYQVSALSAGKWGNAVKVSLKSSSLGAGFCDIDVTLTVMAEDSNGDKKNKETVERFVGVGMERAGSLSSAVVSFAIDASGGAVELDTAARGLTRDVSLSNGKDSSTSVVSDYNPIFTALRDIDDISLIVLPGDVWSSKAAASDGRAKYEAAISHAQAAKDRMVLVQLKEDDDSFNSNFSTVSVPLDKFASVFFPTADVKMTTPGAGFLTARNVSATGHVAGIFARTDQEKNVWTAPAGMQADIRGITRLTRNISQVNQEAINSNNINALRYIEGIPVVWGTRTRDKAGIYEYVPVMRTAFLIADSLRAALSKVVFAKNTEVLWKNVKASVNGFMGELYTQGAFQGATPSQAFQVFCGLGESMQQSEIDGGLLRVTVRFKPAKPAEFIEVSIEQIFQNAA